LFLVPKAADGEIDVEAVLTHCPEHLSAFNVPAEVHVIDQIPRTGSGNIKRFELLDRLQPAAEAARVGRR
jgi:long-chain acyl-CoA synthetase